MVCEKCGFENRADARFCKQCGASLPDQPAPTAAGPQPPGTICPFCGATARTGARFCPRCGKELPVEPGPASPASTEPSMPPGAQISTQPSMPDSSTPYPSTPPTDQIPGGYARPPSQPPPPAATPTQAERRFPRWLWWVGGVALFLCLIAVVMTTIAFGPDLFGAKEDPTAQPTPPATIAAEAPASAFGAQIGIAAPTDTARIGELISVTITVSNTGAVAVSNLRYQLVGAWMPHLESVTDPVMRHEVEVPPGGFDRQAFELRAAQEGNATLQGYVMLDVPTDSGSRQGLLSEETVAIVVTPP